MWDFVRNRRVKSCSLDGTLRKWMFDVLTAGKEMKSIQGNSDHLGYNSALRKDRISKEKLAWFNGRCEQDGSLRN